jgi:hypothetical protein
VDLDLGIVPPRTHQVDSDFSTFVGVYKDDNRGKMHRWVEFNGKNAQVGENAQVEGKLMAEAGSE